MGDVAMAVPVVRALVDQYPDIKFTFVSKPFLEPLFDNISNLTFYPVQVKDRHKGLPGLFRLYRELKKQHITHIADLHNVLRSKILRTLFRFSGMNIAYIDKGRAEKKALTRITDKVFKQLKTTHERYADVFKGLGVPVDISKITSVEPIKLTNTISSITGDKDELWVGIAPFAAFEGKQYPLPLMEAVISALSKKLVRIFLFGGGEKEISLLERMADKFQNVKNISGKLSLKDELVLIAHLDLMISMDSANGHLSAMQHTKTITLWGVTHPFAGFAPFAQPDHYCLLPDLKKYPNIPCSVYGNKICPGYEEVMRTIKPETIISKIEAVFKHIKKSSGNPELYNV